MRAECYRLSCFDIPGSDLFARTWPHRLAAQDAVSLDTERAVRNPLGSLRTRSPNWLGTQHSALRVRADECWLSVRIRSGAFWGCSSVGRALEYDPSRFLCATRADSDGLSIESSGRWFESTHPHHDFARRMMSVLASRLHPSGGRQRHGHRTLCAHHWYAPDVNGNSMAQSISQRIGYRRFSQATKSSALCDRTCESQQCAVMLIAF